MSEMANGWSFPLQFGAAIALLCAAAAVWRQWVRRWNYREGTDLRLLDQYEHAWLQFGRRKAIQRAIVNLLRKGNLRLDPVDPQRVHLQDFENVAHPLEVDVLDVVARFGTLQIERIYPAVITTVTPYRLARAGLIPQPGKRWLSMLPAVFVVPGMLWVGLGEVSALVAADHFALPELLLTVVGVTAFVRLCLPPVRTILGDRVLERLRQTAPRRDRVSTRLAVRVNPMRKVA